jgi:hypothetical protein
MEMGIAVISGNLPLLRPLFESFFRLINQTIFASKGGSLPTQHGTASRTANQSYIARVKAGSKGFERMSDEMTDHTGNQQGSDMEMGDMAILVKTDLTVTTSEIRNGKDERKNAGW